MTKKQLGLILVAIGLLSAYVYYFTDLFASESIQIVHTIRPATLAKRPRARGADPNASANAVSFALDRKCKLTEVQVIPVSDVTTNKYPHPIWHLVSESNSVPVKGFVYGMRIQGMHPAVPGAQADPLEPHTPYRLLITTSELKGGHDFKTTERIGAQQ